MTTDTLHTTKLVVDAAAAGVTVAAILQWLPPIAAALSIVWLCIQITEWALNKRKKSHVQSSE